MTDWFLDALDNDLDREFDEMFDSDLEKEKMLDKCLLLLNEVSDNSKLVTKNARHPSVKNGVSLSGEPMYYKVDLDVISRINNFLDDI